MKVKLHVPILVTLGAFPASALSSFLSDDVAGLIGTIYAAPILFLWFFWLDSSGKLDRWLDKWDEKQRSKGK